MIDYCPNAFHQVLGSAMPMHFILQLDDHHNLKNGESTAGANAGQGYTSACQGERQLNRLQEMPASSSFSTLSEVSEIQRGCELFRIKTKLVALNGTLRD